ncbi:MAG: hypothetical protein INR73_03090 [Williamsia sp.]|nr:hypothetical protein [Williamsia sp.]
MRKFIFILTGVALLFSGCSMFKGRFSEFPVNKTFTVNFTFPDLANEEFSDREKADQARDWLLYTVLSNSGLKVNELAESTYDLAPVRYGFNSTLANFDYGETRSKFIGNGEVVALIPVSDDQTKMDNIAHILDEARKNQGEKPEKVFVFEYDLNTEGKFARITQRDDLDAGDHFTEKMGYVEMPVRSLEDLKVFMNKTEDVTYASRDGSMLVFGGRKLFTHKYGKATPEDVAAIWQSEKYIAEEQSNYFISKASAVKELSDQGELASSSGFSLDPAIDYEKSIELVNNYPSWFGAVLSPDYTVSQLLQQLRHKEGHLMSYAMAKGEAGFGLEEYEQLVKTYSYQKARYDGKLQGTQVGMTLFYTDLLAKIWAGNRFRSKPIDVIADFKDHEQSYLSASKVFNKESESLSAVRLWFGPNKNGFQTNESKNDLNFARNATQIFALSSNPSEPLDSNGISKHVEQQASAEFEVALSWWNNHYEEVATYEQQYERLNEIMKWSTIISWLDAEDSKFYLDFLDNYPVNRSLWFPDWARTNESLKFNDWNKVAFFPRGHLGDKTESLPILFSPNKLIHGGVSLAEKSLVKEAPGLLPAEKSLFRRANITRDYDRGENAFTTFKETKIDIAENIKAKTVSIDLKPKDGFKLRSRFGEVENTAFEWDLIQESSGSFSITSKLNRTPIGELHSTHMGKNGFTIGFESHAVDKGMAIAKQSSDFNGDIKAFLSNHPEIERYVRAENGDWCIQTRNDKEWMVMRIYPSDAEGTVNLQRGWQARTSGSRLDSKIVEMKWVDESEVKKLSPNFSTAKKPGSTVLDEAPETLRNRLIKEKGEKVANLELNAIRDKGIVEAEALAVKNEFERAALLTDKLVQHFGETLQLNKMKVRFKLQAGLKEMESGNYTMAVNNINEALTTHPFKNSTEYLREIEKVLENSPIAEAVKSRIHNMGDIYYTDKQMAIPVYCEGYKRTARPVTAINEAFNQRDAKIFYDKATFNSMDPSGSFHETIAKIRTMPGIQVYDISAETVGKNTRLYASIEPDLNTASENLTNLKAQRFRFRVSPGSSSNNCKDEDNDKCDKSYTVPGHVYYVTAASLN